MFLASLDGLGPIASVFLFVVEEAADTELFSGGRVPAGPVTDAGGLVSEDAVLPVARPDTDGCVCWKKIDDEISFLDFEINGNVTTLTGKLFALAGIAPPRVVAVLEKAARTSSENQAIGAVELFGSSINALPVAIAVGDIGHHLALGLARIGLCGL